MHKHKAEQSMPDIRALSLGERIARFKAHKEKLAKAPDLQDDGWNPIDDPLTPDQLRRLPAARSAHDTRTPELRVRLRHPATRKLVSGTGYFDFDGGVWMARMRPDYWGEVEVRGWKNATNTR